MLIDESRSEELTDAQKQSLTQMGFEQKVVYENKQVRITRCGNKWQVWSVTRWRHTLCETSSNFEKAIKMAKILSLAVSADNIDICVAEKILIEADWDIKKAKKIKMRNQYRLSVMLTADLDEVLKDGIY